MFIPGLTWDSRRVWMRSVSKNSLESRCLLCDGQEHHPWFHFWTNSNLSAAGGMDNFGIGCRFDELRILFVLGNSTEMSHTKSWELFPHHPSPALEKLPTDFLSGKAGTSNSAWYGKLRILLSLLTPHPHSQQKNVWGLFI